MIRIVAAAIVALVADGGHAQERVVPPDGVVTASVNGAPARIRLDPAATAMPLLSAELAHAAGLKPSMVGVAYAVGPVRVSGASRVARLSLGDGASLKRRVAWASRPYAAGVDGVVGPGGLPDAVVRFVLRPMRTGEITVSFRMVDQGGMMGGWAERFAVIDVGGSPMRLRFDPHHRRTLATAGAAVRLAKAYGGTIRDDAMQEEIAFGVERPVRTMTLATPLLLGALAIRTIGVRTADGGSASGIEQAGAPPPDPDEVVVTARGKRNPDRDRLALGADVLSACSSIVFDKPAAVVRLTCG